MGALNSITFLYDFHVHFHIIISNGNDGKTKTINDRL